MQDPRPPGNKLGRRRYRWDPVARRFSDEVPVRAGPPPRQVAPAVLPDLKPYQSIITGETVDGRAAHREHLRSHNQQELGSYCPPFLRRKYEREGVRPEFLADGRRKL